ncbi:dihydroxyacetone kinase subunit L [Pseudotabrizicola sediminis]|uniref:Dihydroxyacetone kinase subunit L n=1 Tax=Pseudotabrizicola sediminis TaxID=2486418 RepID=A0ABY2KHK2_9RHOB|nr:dihydroxyacetone kinase subunit L [Pseudotabrizicola sediminis]TGD41764.1 dihydroxyacetone kinase subunit L [Pseudotabrizicola sediminis]
MLTRDSLAAGLARLANHMDSVADELNALDGQLGDGDLGITMVRGGRAVRDLLSDLPVDLGQALLQVAQAFTRTSGSSFGTLTATGLMAAAKALKGREAADWSETSALLMAAFEVMRMRGKADLGDKTVLDTLHAAATATEGLTDAAEIRTAALTAVIGTMDRMRGKHARIGRARIFGEKSVGLDDPGMRAFLHMLRGIAPP